jgi:CBS domain-containing protein
MDAKEYTHSLVSGDRTAAHAMTAPAIACRQEAFLEEAAEILADRDISGMPVIDDHDRVVGVISERDLACALGGPMIRLALRRHNGKPLHGVAELPRGDRRVKSIMTTPALSVAADELLVEVARLMRVHQINRVPVVDGDRLIGVVTRGDVLADVAHMTHRPIDLTTPPIRVGSDSHQGVGI